MAWFFPWLKVVPEYQRVAVFRLGRVKAFRGPGLVWYSPLFERLVYVDQRIVSVNVPPQECMTADNIPLNVNAIVMYRIVDPSKAVVEVEDSGRATLEIAQSHLRSAIGQWTLDRLLASQAEISKNLQDSCGAETAGWGVKVVRVEIRDMRIPTDLKNAMAKEAAAERERRAMVIRAKGEKEAAEQLAQAAMLLEQSPSGFQMRYLQALPQIAQAGNTVVFGAE